MRSGSTGFPKGVMLSDRFYRLDIGPSANSYYLENISLSFRLGQMAT